MTNLCPTCCRRFDAPATAQDTPLQTALYAVAALTINPLCSREHAEKLLREDMEAIVRGLAKALTEERSKTND